MKKSILAVLFACILAIPAFAHDPNATGQGHLREWHLTGHRHIHGSLLFLKGEEVVLQNEKGEAKSFLLSELSADDQAFVRERYTVIQKLNTENTADTVAPVTGQTATLSPFYPIVGTVLLGAALLLMYFFVEKKKFKSAFYLATAGLACAIFGFKMHSNTRFFGGGPTDPIMMDSAFVPFKPHVVTHWDNTWFYVESQGIPTTHNMMAGITKWQQQVPIPQCYLGTNAWQIPLNPVLAAAPVPVNQQHFLRGAVAVAANGIPIFNPYTNTGVDALLDGQLDQWGGHCGRADDYHYHIAPLHLYGSTAATLPIAYGLDGFAVYGSVEPDGTPMLPLDANHGHFAANGVYHYHGTATAPYMIGNMVGQVTEDNTLQIIPQPHATPVRPSLTPLNGATITNCQPNAAGNGYTVTYTKSGETYMVEYSWTNAGVYTFHFIAPSGTTTSTYNGFIPCFLPTATEDPEANTGLIIAPNPSHQGFWLKLEDNIQASTVENTSVISSQGQLIFSKNGFAEKLETSGWAKGVYFVWLKTAHKMITQKIILD